MGPPLTDREYRLFAEWIEEEYGINFGPERRDILRSRLETRRMELGFPTFERFFFHLKFHPRRQGERTRLISRLTNNESYFFRERAQLDMLRDLVPDRVCEIRGEGRPFRVLSAGCASGEEPYTLAITLAELSALRPAGLEVTGVDVDECALERARRGVYSDHGLRGVEPALRDRSFHPREGRWELDHDIRSMVRFRTANIASDSWARSVPPQDVIFCRNVLIYFSEEAMERAVNGFWQALAPGGYLFLGHAETLSRIPNRFVPQRRPGVVYYQRPAA